MINTTNKRMLIDFNLNKDELLNLNISDVVTYELHYNSTYSLINKVKINRSKIENILIKFQIANLMRIDGITDKNDIINELYADIDDFNGFLIEVENIQKELTKHIGKKFLQKLNLNNGIDKKFIYQTKDSSPYFKTYILICGQDMFQIEFTFCDEISNYFKKVVEI